MTKEKGTIGQNIICGKSGIGEITDVIPLYEGQEELFYKVTFPDEPCVSYFAVNNQSNYRLLSSEKVLNDAIEIFKLKFDEINYGTTQERINIQKEMLKGSDVCELAKALSIMNSEKNLHPQISKPFRETLNTFVDEIMFVLDIKRSEAYALLGLKATVKKVKN